MKHAYSLSVPLSHVNFWCSHPKGLIVKPERNGFFATLEYFGIFASQLSFAESVN